MLDGSKHRAEAEAVLEPGSPAALRVGWGFIWLYALAYMSTSLLFVAPLLVTLPLKVNSLVGIKQAPTSLVGRAPVAVAIDPAAQTIYTANGDNTVSIIPAIR
jgi:hypothetical protein